MHGQMRSDNAVPILDDTAGSHRLIPCRQQATSRDLPRGIQRLQQLLGLLAQDHAALPRPGDEPHCWRSQLVDGLVLSSFHLRSLVQQGRQRQPHLLDHALHFVLQRGGDHLDGLLQ